MAKKTEQIVDMLRRMPNHQLLVAVIKRNLALDFLPQSTKALGVNPISLASVRKRCELMCKFLLERMLQVFLLFVSVPNILVVFSCIMFTLGFLGNLLLFR